MRGGVSGNTAQSGAHIRSSCECSEGQSQACASPRSRRARKVALPWAVGSGRAC